MDDLDAEFQALRLDLEKLDKPELIERIKRAFNTLMIAEIMVRNKIASTPHLAVNLRMAQKDLRGIRGDGF